VKYNIPTILSATNASENRKVWSCQPCRPNCWNWI